MPLLAGTHLGPYEITVPLGAGGMGEVYRARDTKLGRDVAIKILSAGVSADPERLARFEREARVLASLNHPNIAHIYGLETVESHGVSFIVMELVEGETLADRLRRQSGHGLPIREAQTIARQICDALDVAHERRIVHRDLKPANIAIAQDGTVKVLDFGLAKEAAGEPSAGDLTHSPTVLAPTVDGMLLGTAPYMSPEQARGKAVDKRTDIWAFGCVLYEMLTGRRAFSGETTTDTIAAILERQPDWGALPPATPPALRRLLERCLEKDPKSRLRDIADARIDLESAGAADIGVEGRKTRARWLPWVIAGIALLVAAAAWLRPGVQTLDSAATTALLGPKLTRITWDAGLAAEPALSPDGSLVAYASDTGGAGGLDLWVQRVAGGTPVRLTSDPADDREPDFSPDGTTLVFRSDRSGGGVFVMPALGGDARLLAAEGRTPRFSPDGTRIAYWVGRTLGGTRVAGARIFVMPANGGEPTELARGFASARTPIWAPGGSSLLFFGAKSAPASDANWDWWWVAATGGEPVATGVVPALTSRGFTPSGVSGIPGQDALPDAWTRDGVLFSAPLDQSANLWRVDVSSATGRSDKRFQRLTSGPSSDAGASIDRNGRIAFQAALTVQGVFALALDTNTGRSLKTTERLVAESNLLPHRGSLSNDGLTLAFPKHRVDTSELWIKDLRTNVERHLATTPRSVLNPVISPDGSQIAYVVTSNNQTASYLVSSAGGTVRKLCDGCSPGAWFEDSHRILITSRSPDGAGSVHVVDVQSGAGGDVVVARAPVQDLGRPMPTRDGRWLAFGGNNRAWIAPLRPGVVATPESAETIELGGGAIIDGRHTGWSPDGHLLYLLLGLDGFRCLYALRFDPEHGKTVGEPFAVHHFHEAKGGIASTPEGTAIVDGAFVYDAFETTGSIWLMDAVHRP